MDNAFDRIELLVIKAKKRAGPLGVLAFAIGSIRAVASSDVDDPAKVSYISEICSLVQKHTKI